MKTYRTSLLLESDVEDREKWQSLMERAVEALNSLGIEVMEESPAADNPE